MYRQVELKEGVMLQFVGTHVVKWPFATLGQPDVGFVEDDTTECLLGAIRAFLEVLKVGYEEDNPHDYDVDNLPGKNSSCMIRLRKAMEAAR